MPLALRSYIRSLLHKLSGKTIRIKAMRDIDVDVVSSKAFMPSHESFSIYINDPSAKDIIINTLLKYDSILKFYEVPIQNKEKNLPDLILVPNFDKGYTIGFGTLYGKPIIKANIVDHHPLGVLIVYSNSFYDRVREMNETLGRWAKIENYSVTPLILHLLNLPIPSYIDVDHYISKLIYRRKNGADLIAKWQIVLRALKFKF